MKTNQEEKIFMAIVNHYNKSNRQVVDVLYSIVRDMYLVKIAETYKGKNCINKVRIVKEDLTVEEVEEMMAK